MAWLPFQKSVKNRRKTTFKQYLLRVKIKHLNVLFFKTKNSQKMLSIVFLIGNLTNFNDNKDVPIT